MFPTTTSSTKHRPPRHYILTVEEVDEEPQVGKETSSLHEIRCGNLEVLTHAVRAVSEQWSGWGDGKNGHAIIRSRHIHSIRTVY